MYHLNSTFRLDSVDAGTQDFPIVYTSYPGDRAVIHGGVSIAPDRASNVTDEQMRKRFSDDALDSVRVVDLKKLGINDYGQLRPVGFSRPFGPAWAELFVNGQPMHLARWPNDSTIPMGQVIDSGSIPRDGDFSDRGGKFKFPTDRPLTWQSQKGIWINGTFNRGWAEDAVAVANIDTANKVFETMQPTLYGFGSGEVYNRWFAYNVLEELDAPGEYYLDRTAGKLYFHASEPIQSLELSVLEDPMVAIKGASNVWFKDLDFECARGIGIYLETTENVVVDGCQLRNLGMVGVVMGQGIRPFDNLQSEGTGELASETIGNYLEHRYANTLLNRMAGKNNGVINSKIYNTGAGGIHLSGGDRKTLEPAGNYVQNCIIHDFNRIERSYRAGVDISGVGNRIARCEIYNAPSMAILLHGNEHLIEYNNIHHVCQEVHDQGALYYGRDPSERGNKVFHNFFHHLPAEHLTAAIYHDDGACGMEVFGNIFYKPGSIPVLIGGGMDNTYTNNIFVDAKIGVRVDNRYQTWATGHLKKDGIVDSRLKAVDYTNPPYSTAYPALVHYWDDEVGKPKRNTVSKNVFVNVEEPYLYVNVQNPEATSTDWMPVLDDNWVTDEDPGFEDMEHLNFELVPDAEVFQKIPGFERIAFEKIGPQKQERD